MKIVSSTEATHGTSFLQDAEPVGFNPLTARCGDLSWPINDSSFAEYAAATFPGYPGGILQILDSHIGRGSQNVGLDLAGGNQGRALRDLLDLRVLGRGLVTNLEDMRNDSTFANPALDHIDGDLAQHSTWDRIIAWQKQQAPNGLSLVMHRPYGALQNQSHSVYLGAAHLLLDMIRPGGVLFSQVPFPLVEDAMAGRAVYRAIYARSDVDKMVAGEYDARHHLQHFQAIIKTV